MRTYLISTLLLIAILAGCGTGKMGQSGPSKGAILRIGTDATYPPFETIDVQSEQAAGFDIDIMKSICKANEWTPVFIVTPFDGIISGLKNSKFDCIISAMTITPEREKEVAFSEPYYLAGQIIAVPLANNTIHSENDLSGRKVGVQLGTTGERLAKSLPGVQVFSFDNIGAAFIDMENGRLDAVLNDWPTTREYIRQKGMAKTVGNLLSKEQYGIAVRKEDTGLVAKINSGLEAIRKSGEYSILEKKWFLAPDEGK